MGALERLFSGMLHDVDFQATYSRGCKVTIWIRTFERLFSGMYEKMTLIMTGVIGRVDTSIISALKLSISQMELLMLLHHNLSYILVSTPFKWTLKHDRE